MDLIIITEDTYINPEQISSMEQRKTKNGARTIVYMSNGNEYVLAGDDFRKFINEIAEYCGKKQFFGG